MKSIAGSISPRIQVFTIHGTKDRTIPFEDAEEFDRVIPTHVLLPVTDAGHLFSTDTNRNDLITSVIEALSCPKTQNQ